MLSNFDDSFLRAQQAYYDARAPEYDEWWLRRGRYDHGAEANAVWFQEQAELYAVLEQAAFQGEVLELACGTGLWTERLVGLPGVEGVTAIDGSAEMLALNAERLPSNRVRRIQADLFAWEPDRQYDSALFTFWLSHVPAERLAGFLEKVRRALRPGGSVFFADSRRDPQTTTQDQPLPHAEQDWLLRRLNDGREFAIVKRFLEPEELEAVFGKAGLAVTARTTERFFVYGSGSSE